MGKMCRLLGLLLTGFLRYRERDGTVPELKGTGQLGVLTQSGLDTTTAQIVLQCYLIFQKRFDAGLIGLQKFILGQRYAVQKLLHLLGQPFQIITKPLLLSHIQHTFHLYLSLCSDIELLLRGKLDTVSLNSPAGAMLSCALKYFIA